MTAAASGECIYCKGLKITLGCSGSTHDEGGLAFLARQLIDRAGTLERPDLVHQDLVRADRGWVLNSNLKQTGGKQTITDYLPWFSDVI